MAAPLPPPPFLARLLRPSRRWFVSSTSLSKFGNISCAPSLEHGHVAGLGVRCRLHTNFHAWHLKAQREVHRPEENQPCRCRYQRRVLSILLRPCLQRWTDRKNVCCLRSLESDLLRNTHDSFGSSRSVDIYIYIQRYTCTHTYTCTFHDVCCSKPLTFHNGFMFCACRGCFKHTCIFQALPAQTDREENVNNKVRAATTHVQFVVHCQEGHRKATDQYLLSKI